MQNKRRRGRPTLSTENARISLIESAVECFSAKPYQAVTTRSVAEKAGVNAALIRYYFLNKEGLYQQMLAHVAANFQQTVKTHLTQYPDNPVEAIMRAHAALCLNNPNVPKLIFKELAFNDGQGQQVVIDSVARPNRQFMHQVFAPLQKKGLIRADFDPTIFMFSILSMSLMPHLLKEVFETLEGLPFDETMIDKIIRQNVKMTEFGYRQTEDKHD